MLVYPSCWRILVAVVAGVVIVVIVVVLFHDFGLFDVVFFVMKVVLLRIFVFDCCCYQC